MQFHRYLPFNQLVVTDRVESHVISMALNQAENLEL